MSVKVLITSIFFIISMSLSARTSRPIHKKITPHKEDIKSARIFSSIYKKITRNKYTLNDIKKLRRTDRNKIFKVYQDEIDTLKLLKIKSSQSNILKICKPNIKNNKGISFKDSLRYRISLLCHKRLLSSVDPGRSESFNKIIVNYFIDNSIFLSQKKSKGFNKFLESLKEVSAKTYQKTSKSIYRTFIKNKYQPPFKSLSALPLNKAFTQFMQTEISSSNFKSKIFTKELDHIYKKIKRSFKQPIKLKGLVQEYSKFYIENHKNIEYKRMKRQVENLTSSLTLKSFTKEANNLVDTFIKIARVDSATEHELIFKKLWISLVVDDYKDAAKKINELDLVQRYSNLSSKLKFWIPYIFKNNNEQGKALSLYQIFLQDGTVTYYSILARKEISLLKDSSPNPVFVDQNKTASYNFSKPEQRTIKRLLTWLELDYFHYASLELAPMLKRAPSANFTTMLYKLTSIFNKHGHYLFTFKAIYKALNKDIVSYSQKTLKHLFPTTFFKDIKTVAKGIDPIVVLSLIRQESAFNPNAKSHVGARGLMQLMPATARQFKKKLKIKHLRNPKINIKLGVKYLTRLLNKYDGNLIYTLSAYNAGESRVRRWRKNLFKSVDPLVNIETIPFNETQNYVKLIYRNIYFYKYIMKKEIKFESLQETFFLAKR